MSGRTEAVVGGFNTLIKSNIDNGVKGKVTLVTFDNLPEVVFEKVKFKECKELVANTPEIIPRGGTALYDAIHFAIKLGNPDKPTLVQVISDGGENASRDISGADVQKLIKQMEDDHDWEFEIVGFEISGETAASGLKFDSKMSGFANVQTAGLESIQGAMGPQGDSGMRGVTYSMNYAAKHVTKKTESTDSE